MEAANPQVEAARAFEPRFGRSVSLEQAAVLLGVSRRTIYNRIREGKLETIRTLGTSQRVLIASLDEYRRTVPPPKPPQEVQVPVRRTVVLPFIRRPVAV